MEVDLSFVQKSDEIIPRRHFARVPWEEEYGEEWYPNVTVDGKEILPVTTIDEDYRLKLWEKFLPLDTLLPDRRQWKLDTEDQGALRMQFSNMGKYLAVACTMTKKQSMTIIKIFDVESSEQPKVILRGHPDLIHDLHWSDDDRYLVSASGDSSAKVWNLIEKESDGVTDKLKY